MGRVVDIGAGDGRLDVASRWVARMDRGLTAAEEAELQAWIAADAKNEQRLLSLTKRWDRMESLSRLAELFPEYGPAQDARRPTLGWAAAAMISALAVTAAALWFARPVPEPPAVPIEVASSGNFYETAIGEQSTEVLTDGTAVVLNTNSLVLVDYSPDARVLHLERGEIHVEVAEDTKRPFSVIAGDRVVQAVGTAFSVEITDERQVELVVTEGKVVVGVSNPGGSPPLIAQSPDNTIRAGEEILLGMPEATVKDLSAEDIEVKLSWRQGRLIFRGEPLEVALAEVERYTTVQFVFLDDDIRAREVIGRFRTGDVEGLLLALRMNFGVDYERVDDGRVLLSGM